MRNIRLLLEYDGAGFAGWQLQVGHRTVEAEVRRAIREITGEQVKLYAAGRTDAGAHAEGQVANFHYAGRLQPARLQAALNARLPPDIAVLELRGEGSVRGLVRGIAGGRAGGGRGRRPPEWLGEALAARDRRLAPKTAPAAGLTLVEVLYEE